MQEMITLREATLKAPKDREEILRQALDWAYVEINVNATKAVIIGEWTVVIPNDLMDKMCEYDTGDLFRANLVTTAKKYGWTIAFGDKGTFNPHFTFSPKTESCA